MKTFCPSGRLADQYLGCPYAPPSGQLPPDADVYSKSDQAVKAWLFCHLPTKLWLVLVCILGSNYFRWTGIQEMGPTMPCGMQEVTLVGKLHLLVLLLLTGQLFLSGHTLDCFHRTILLDVIRMLG